MQTPHQQIELARIRSEHEGIQAMIRDERTWWKELREFGRPRLQEMGIRLQQLRARLAEHFEHEERAEGNAAAVGDPQMPLDALKRLRAEHAQLLGALDGIIARTSGCGCGEAFECWGDAGDAFAQFIDRLEEHEAAELKALETIITTAKKRGVTCSICGQAPSFFPDLTAKLVSWGITSVSVSPDAVNKTRKIVYDIEAQRGKK